MIIALTGTIGTGKTTAAKIFQENGCEIINVDALGHKLLQDPEILQKILAEFGSDIMDRQLQIDREKLSEIVFNDEAKLKILNKMIHPKLKAALDKTLYEIRQSSQIFILDVALFEELELQHKVDKVLLLKSDLENIYKRLNPKYTKRQVLTIINNQKQPVNADFIIENNGPEEILKEKIRKILEEIKQ